MRGSRDLLVWTAAVVGSTVVALAQQDAPSAQQAVIGKYCISCHSAKLRTGRSVAAGCRPRQRSRRGRNLGKSNSQAPHGRHAAAGMPRPDAATVNDLASYLETSLDQAAAAKPNPGHAAMHRLNRAEYANAIRDLLALDVDADALCCLPTTRAAASTISPTFSGCRLR